MPFPAWESNDQIVSSQASVHGMGGVCTHTLPRPAAACLQLPGMHQHQRDLRSCAGNTAMRRVQACALLQRQLSAGSMVATAALICVWQKGMGRVGCKGVKKTSKE